MAQGGCGRRGRLPSILVAATSCVFATSRVSLLSEPTQEPSAPDAAEEPVAASASPAPEPEASAATSSDPPAVDIMTTDSPLATVSTSAARDAILSMSHGLSDFERGASGANSTKEEVFRYLHGVNANLKLLAQLLAKQEMSYAAELSRVKTNYEGEVGDLREQMQQKETEKTRQVRELAHAKQTLDTIVGKERMAERQFATSERMRGTMAYRAEQLLAEQQLLRSRLKDLRSKDFVRENASLKRELAAAERERDRLRASSAAVVHEEAKLVEENHQKAQCPELKSKFEKLFEQHNRLQLEHDAVLQQKTTCLQQLEAPADPEDAMVEKRHVGGKLVVDKDEFAKMVQSYVKMQSREVLEDVITQKLMRDFEKHKEHESGTGSAAKVKVKRNRRASANKNHRHKRLLHQKKTKKQASRKNAGKDVGVQSDEGLVAKLVARKKQALHNLLHRDFLEGAGAGENDADFVAVDKWVR